MSRELSLPLFRKAAGRGPAFIAKALVSRSAYWLVLPGRLVAHYADLPKGSDHEQILSMFVNTAFWTLVGVVAVIVAV